MTNIKWEYTATRVDRGEENAILTQYGQDGWEAWYMEGYVLQNEGRISGHGAKIYFKRRLP